MAGRSWWRARYGKEPGGSPAELDKRAARLSELGRPAEALPVTEEAVAIRRELAAASPARYRPDLARSTRLLASTLESLGRTAEAEAARRTLDT